MRFSSSCLAVLLLGGTACTAESTATRGDHVTGPTVAVPEKTHEIAIRVKGFVAPIKKDDLGGFGEVDRDARLRSLADDMNVVYAENPALGAGPTPAGQYRLWSEVVLSVRCQGAKPTSVGLVRSGLDVVDSGPLGSVAEPLITRVSGDQFYFQARGSANPAAAKTLDAIHGRFSSTVWFAVGGRVVCGDDGEAKVVADASTTGFPSFRMWIARDGGDEELALDRVQGKLDSLWALPAAPEAPPDMPE